MKTKDTNPKEALGICKVPLHTIPCEVLMELGLAMMEGGRKYGTHNYRNMGVRMSTYYDASLRHIMAWWEGEDIDPDSGIPHLIKAMASLLVVQDSIHMQNAVDDRPIQLPMKVDVESFNHQAEEIIKKYPECKTPFTQKELDDLPSYVKDGPFAEVVKGLINSLPPINTDEYPFDIPEWIEDLPSLKQLNDENEQKMRDMFARSPFLKPHTAYFSHHIRGVKGDDATDKEMDANREDAIKVCNQLRELLSDWKIYCPAEVDEVVSELFKSGAIGEKGILDADCKILERRDMLFAYIKDGYVSRGMQIEMDHAKKKKIPIFQFSIWNEHVENALRHIQNYGVSNCLMYFV